MLNPALITILLSVPTLAIGAGLDIPAAMTNAGMKSRGASAPACMGIEYRVAVNGSGVSVSSVPSLGMRQPLANEVAFKGARFEYVAKNRGEWGGALTVRTASGPPRKILDDNVIAMLPRGNDLWVISGLSHLNGDEGALWIVESFDSSPKLRLATRLPSAPEVITLSKHDRYLYLASWVSLMRISIEERLEVLAINMFMLGGITSLVAQPPYFFIGSCGSVASVYTPRLDFDIPPRDVMPTIEYWSASAGDNQ